MRLKDGYVIKEIVGNIVVIPVGQALMDSGRPTRMLEDGVILTQMLQYGMNTEEMIEEYSRCAECDITKSTEVVNSYIEYGVSRGFIELS